MSIDDKELDRRLIALQREVETDEVAEERTWQAIAGQLDINSEPKQASHTPFRARRFYAGLSVAASFVLVMLMADPLSRSPISVSEFVINAEIKAMHQQLRWDDIPENSSLNGGFRTAWNDNQQAINELENALKRNPDSPMLVDFLARAQLRHVELIHYASAHRDVDHERSM